MSIVFENNQLAMLTRERNESNMRKIDSKTTHIVKLKDSNNTIFSYKEKPSDEAIERHKNLITDIKCISTKVNDRTKNLGVSKDINIYENNDDYVKLHVFISMFPSQNRTKAMEYIERFNVLIYTYKNKQKYVKKQDFMLMRVNTRNVNFK